MWALSAAKESAVEDAGERGADDVGEVRERRGERGAYSRLHTFGSQGEEFVAGVFGEVGVHRLCWEEAKSVSTLGIFG